MKDLRSKTDEELVNLVAEARKTVQEERFKDAFSRKAGVIRAAKLDIARALTELTQRRRTPASK
jgi:ribosomal protein L29